MDEIQGGSQTEQIGAIYEGARATVYLATPIWRYLDVRAAHSITAAIAMNPPRETICWETIDGDALISRSRSQLATKFLSEPGLKNADVMVILDDDVQFNPQDLWKIVDGAREKNALYGGIYVTRSREPHTAALAHADASQLTFGENGGPVPIRYLATGFMAVPRVVLEAMLEHDGFDTIHGKEKIVYCTQGVGDLPMYDLFRPFEIREADGRVHYLSEDWAFCERARQCGFEVYADTSIILHHRAVVSVTVADLAIPGHALSKEGSPSKGSSVLITSPEEEPVTA